MSRAGDVSFSPVTISAPVIAQCTDTQHLLSSERATNAFRFNANKSERHSTVEGDVRDCVRGDDAAMGRGSGIGVSSSIRGAKPNPKMLKSHVDGDAGATAGGGLRNEAVANPNVGLYRTTEHFSAHMEEIKEKSQLEWKAGHVLGH
jgi:hypothetical protein